VSEGVVRALGQSMPKPMRDVPPRPRNGVVRVEADAIYGGTVARLHITDGRPFRVKVSGETLRVLRGEIEPDGEWLASVGSEQNQELQVELLGLFHETSTRRAVGEGPWHRYGMRFYPFISSSLHLRVECGAPLVRNLMVDFPSTFLAIWYARAVRSEPRVTAHFDQSVGKDRSLYLIRWDTEVASFQADFLVRLGGRELAAIVLYPLIYWFLALVTLAVFAWEKNPTLALGGLGALFAFMLREWREARAPQQNTLLTAGYVLAGIIATAWVGLWRAVRVLGVGWAPLVVASALILVILGLIFRDVRRFALTGVLPNHVEWVWTRLVRQADWEQRQAIDSDNA
jgi:hypothetical protein